MRVVSSFPIEASPIHNFFEIARYNSSNIPDLCQERQRGLPRGAASTSTILKETTATATVTRLTVYHSHISPLRRALPPPQAVHNIQGGCRVVVDPPWVCTLGCSPGLLRPPLPPGSEMI